MTNRLAKRTWIYTLFGHFLYTLYPGKKSLVRMQEKYKKLNRNALSVVFNETFINKEFEQHTLVYTAFLFFFVCFLFHCDFLVLGYFISCNNKKIYILFNLHSGNFTFLFQQTKYKRGT